MLNEFILVSGWAFWIIIGLLLLIDISILSWADDDLQGWAVGLAVAGALGVVLFTDAFSGVRVSTLIIAALAYIGLGVLWAVKKWYSFLIEKRDYFRQLYAKISDPKKESWEEYVADRRPTATDNKQRITTWMTLWPFSLSWWVLTWPRRAFVWLYDRLSTMFDRISQRVFAA